MRPARRRQHLVHEPQQRAAEIPGLEPIERRVLAATMRSCSAAIVDDRVDQRGDVHGSLS